MIVEKTDAELKQLAIDIADNKVFTSNQIGEKDSHLLLGCFMPLLFLMNDEKWADWIDKVGLVYESYSKALNTGINGLPCFSSCQILHVDQVEKMEQYMQEYIKLKTEFMQ